MRFGDGQDHRGTLRHLGATVCRPALIAGLLAGLLVACTASSVLTPPAEIGTAMVSASAPAFAPRPPYQPTTSAAPAPVVASEPFQAAPPQTYGAPQANVAALPSYETLIAGGEPMAPADPASIPPGWAIGPAAINTPVAPAAAAQNPDWQAPAATSAGLAPRSLGTLSVASTTPSVQPVPQMAAPTFAPAATVASAPVYQSATPPVLQAAPPPAAPPQMAPPQSTPEEPRRLAGLFPRALNPFGRRETSVPGVPAAEAACQERLKRLGVAFSTPPAVGKGNSCGIAHPVEIAGLSGDIRIQPATTLNCPMAEAFALWVEKELAPGVRKRYLSGISSIGSMGGYSCRTMNSRRGAPMSEHSKGNAIDVGKITLNSGKSILVRSKGFFAFRERGLLKSVRDDGCRYFTTILGPGSDANHADHFHFDLRARKNGYRHCD